MSQIRFILNMAWRESRASRRRLGLLTAAISVGVAGLVAVNSFTASLRDSVRHQAQALLGADLALASSNRFSNRAEGLLTALQADAKGPGPGARLTLARVTSFAAMAYVPRTSGARLVQVAAIEGGYPFYGEIETEPRGVWASLARDHVALVDAALLAALGAQVGDSLALGEGRFVIGGIVTKLPGDVAVRAAFAPRLFIEARHLDETRLLGFGARARYEAFLKLPGGVDPQRLAEKHRAALAAERVTLRTVSEDERSLNASLTRLGRYLGLVALIALLLGGLGVASAVHVFIQRKLETVAVLRCLGASSRQVLAVYLGQAAAMGLLGSLLGAGLGAALQTVLPRILRDFLPVDVPFSLSRPAIAAGIAMGVWVAVLFSLLPLLTLRRVSPLFVFRRAFESGPRRAQPRERWLALGVLAASVVFLSAAQAGSLRRGLAFAGGIGLALGALCLAAFALIRTIRRYFPYRWPYLWRQGLANLYRPANQTLSVVLSLGFGSFLLSTLLLVQHNLLRDLRVGGGGSKANLLLFDIQPDQREALAGHLRRAGLPAPPPVPIVPMRLLSVKGMSVAKVLAAPPTLEQSSNRWAFRREYRSTYRDHLVDSERRVAGEAWRPGEWRDGWQAGQGGRLGFGRSVQDGGAVQGGGPVPISVETDLAEELGVSVGDEIVWDVQGVALPSRVANLREVDWARFEPNFFVVFPEGPLARAPQTFLTLTRIEDPAARARFQRAIVEAFPNVTALDLSQVQQAVERIIGSVARAIRIMALLSLATGAVVLVGAVATSRYQRLREVVLLKTLGARRSQVLRILFAEYVCLGGMAALTALVLSSAAGWALVRFAFEGRFTLPVLPLASLALLVVALTVLVGLANSADALRRTPLAALRAE